LVLLALLSLSSAVALTCRPQLRASQPAKCVRASPPSMTSEADLLRLQEEIQRLQLQAEIIRLQAQAEAAAVAAAPIVTPPVVAAPIVPPPAVVALPQLTAPVPEPDVAERIVDAVKDTLLPSSSPIDDVAAAAAVGAQELVLNIDSANSVGLDRAYPLLVLLGLSILPLLLSIANAAAKAVTGKSLFLGRIDTYDPRGPSSKDTPKRNAREIFDAGLTNLKAEPTAWLFGPPSALYSNEPPPAAPPPAGVAAPPSAPPAAAPIAAVYSEPEPELVAPQPAAAEIAAPAPEPAEAPAEGKGKKNRYTKRAEKKPKGQGTRATRS